MNNFSPIPAKLLLFGEHSVLIGSPAILVPLNDFTASLKFPYKELNQESIDSNAYLKRFSSYIRSNSEWFSEHINLEEFEEALKDGLFLDSDIPEGYGLGSSASVCVAVYKAFGISDMEDTAELKLFYSRMESFFHGKSSGIDPLTIHACKPVVIDKEKICFLDKDQKLLAPEINLYLMDSGVSRNAGDIIRLFQSELDDPQFRNDFVSSYLPVLTKIKNDILKGNQVEWNHLVELSHWQFKFYRKLIPLSVLDVWNSSSQICIKLLGAGGGGYFLAFSKERLNEYCGFKLVKVK